MADRVATTEVTPFHLPARQGDANAQFNLGLLYTDGKDLPRDYATARYWHRKAARQGHSAARYSLALMHHKGLGIPRDEARTARWYKLAAARGHQASQFNLALLYDQGYGVPRDPVMAYVWFFLAAARGAARTSPHDSSAPIASRLAYSASKGGQAAKGNCERMAFQLNAVERERAERLALSYCARYVLPFR